LASRWYTLIYREHIFALVVARKNSLTRSLVGFVTFANRWGHCVRDGGAVLIRHRGCGALIQEDLS
jgi:hypothetical protein